MIVNRCGKILFFIGISVLVISTLVGPTTYTRSSLHVDHPAWIMIRALDDFSLSLELDDDTGNFTFYVLDYDDTVHIQETGDMNITDPVFTQSFVTSYTGVIEISSPGLYSILIITESTENLSVWINQSALRPPMMLLVFSTSSILSGFFLIFLERLLERREIT